MNCKTNLLVVVSLVELDSARDACRGWEEGGPVRSMTVPERSDGPEGGSD